MRDTTEAKAALRARVWDALRKAEVDRFPGAEGRIPNFVGAEAAAERLQETRTWRFARTIKANPDVPQWPVRQRALEDGKKLYMAVPRLARDRPFFLLDPTKLHGSPRAASSINGASRSAPTVGLDEMEPIDFVVTGCVAVGRDGARLGKGGGFSDLEFAIASEVGLIGPTTIVVTTVHPLQVFDAGLVPRTDHDLVVDFVVTPDEVIETTTHRPRPRVHWQRLTEEQIAAIPVLQRLRP